MVRKMGVDLVIVEWLSKVNKNSDYVFYLFICW